MLHRDRSEVLKDIEDIERKVEASKRKISRFQKKIQAIDGDIAELHEEIVEKKKQQGEQLSKIKELSIEIAVDLKYRNYLEAFADGEDEGDQFTEEE